MVFTPNTNTKTNSWFLKYILPIASGISMLLSFCTATKYNLESFGSLDHFKKYPTDWVALVLVVHVMLLVIMVALIQADNNGLSLAGSSFDIKLDRGFYKSVLTITMWGFAIITAFEFGKTWMNANPVLRVIKLILLALGFAFFVIMPCIVLANADLSKDVGLDDSYALNGKLYLILMFFVIAVCNSAWTIIYGNFIGVENAIASKVIKFICIIAMPLLIALMANVSFNGYIYNVDLSKPGYYVTIILALVAWTGSAVSELFRATGSSDVWHTILLIVVFLIIAIVALIKSGLSLSIVYFLIPTYMYLVYYEYKAVKLVENTYKAQTPNDDAMPLIQRRGSNDRTGHGVELQPIGSRQPQSAH